MDNVKKPVLMIVPLQKINIWSNTRKVFDEDAINELAASVKEKGVIQPILLRNTKKEGVYELVCGERRYRASGIAGLKDIPAYIRDLSDEEALELQITENLQRKDVHPMEEAFAFKQLLEKHPIEEIAARVGKKEYFVRQRLKLNELNELWQKAFYKNLLPLHDALKIAALSEDIQLELQDQANVSSERIESGDSIRLSDWIYDRLIGKLNKAPFDRNDDQLDAKAGACTSCRFNSAYANLFPDSAKDPICSNQGCYKNKSNIHFDRAVQEALADPTIILISSDYSVDKEIKEKYRKEGHEVLSTSSYDSVHEYDQEDKPDWEEFKQENEDDYDTYEELKEAFERDCKEYEEEREETQKKISSGKYVKAFYVEGHKKGTYTYIRLYQSGSQKVGKAPVSAGEPTAADIDAEISRIKDKEKRAKELDAEKVHALIIQFIKEDKDFKKVPEAFTDVDRILMLYILCDVGGYSIKELVKKTIGLNISYDMPKGEKLYPLLEKLTDEQLAFLVRTIAFDKYNTHLPQNNGGFMLRKLAENLGTVPIEAYEKEQNEKAAKRQKRVEQRIAELQEQKKQLLPKPQTKTASKKAAVKK